MRRPVKAWAAVLLIAALSALPALLPAARAQGACASALGYDEVAFS